MSETRSGDDGPGHRPEHRSTGRFSAWDALLVVPVAVSLLPLLRGWPRGHDWRYELVKIAEFGHAVGSGQLPPHWAENLYGGLGSTIFLFYAPVYAAVASAAGAAVGSLPRGGILALVGFTVFGAYAVYRTAAHMAGGQARAGRIAAAVFILHPYLIGDVLLRNATSEFSALCVVPLALWGVVELRDRPRRGAALIAGGLGLTVITHNITALVMFAIVAAAGAWLYRGRGERSAWPWLAVGLGLALGMSAFFWLPALALRDLVQTDSMITGRFDFRENFPAFGSLFGYSRFFGAGWLAALILVASLASALRWRGEPSERLSRFLVVVALALVALMTPLTTVVWEHTPLLPYLQFPWRLQGPLAAVTALLAGCLLGVGSQGWSSGRRRGVEVAVVTLAIANALPHLLAGQPLTAEEAAWADVGLTAEALSSGVYRASVLDEYLPVSADPGALAERSGRGSPVLTPPDAVHTVHQDTGSRITLDVVTESGAWLTLQRWDFPGWEARVGSELAPTRVDPLGRLQVQVEAGSVRVELRKRAPGVRRAALSLSAIALLLWIGLLSIAPRREPTHT